MIKPTKVVSLPEQPPQPLLTAVITNRWTWIKYFITGGCGALRCCWLCYARFCAGMGRPRNVRLSE